MVESRNVSVHLHLYYAKQEFSKNKHLLAKKGVFALLTFFRVQERRALQIWKEPMQMLR